jgi:glycosyltransferase involved in cell wall biosynthesis
VPTAAESAIRASASATEGRAIRVLHVTNMWPDEARPAFGIFVREQVDSLTRLGVESEVFVVDGRSSTWNYARAFGPVRRKVRAGHYDLVHAHYVFSGLIARGQRRRPIVLTHYGIEALQGWQAPLCWAATRMVDATIAVSEPIRRKLGRDDVTVIPNGIDVDFFRPTPKAEARARADIRPDERIVLFVGLPRPEKRFDVVEAAMDVLQARGEAARLIHVKGQYDRAMLPVLMNAADVLVLTSDGEGSPMAVKEALACTLPVVSVPVGDVPELLEGLSACRLCTQDPSDVADKLADVLRNPVRADSRARIEAISHEAVARRILDVYGRVAGAGAPAAAATGRRS